MTDGPVEAIKNYAFDRGNAGWCTSIGCEEYGHCMCYTGENDPLNPENEKRCCECGELNVQDVL